VNRAAEATDTEQREPPPSSGGRTGRRLADRLIDLTARRPHGWIARKTYGGTQGAPKGHEEVFDRVLDAIGALDGERCLEVGCGGGRLLERVLAAGAHAAGVDHSSDMLDLTSQRNRGAVETGALELKLGEAESLPWPDATFNVLLSANTFFFIAQPERCACRVPAGACACWAHGDCDCSRPATGAVTAELVGVRVGIANARLRR
jgi:SAM-dependent methyltransferase